MRVSYLAVAAAIFATSAEAAVTSTSATGFRIENHVTVAATPDQVWTALGQIGGWWSSDHTYSGSSANMTMPLKVGACFCEALPGGGVEHGRVIMVWPQYRLLRIETALGPLQDEAVSGVLSFQVKPAKGGAEIVETYNVGGARPETVAMWPKVNAVLSEQLDHLKAYVDAKKP